MNRLLLDEEIRQLKEQVTKELKRKNPTTNNADIAREHRRRIAKDQKALTTQLVIGDLREMELIKNHNHKKGEVKVIACARCTFDEWVKSKITGGE